MGLVEIKCLSAMFQHQQKDDLPNGTTNQVKQQGQTAALQQNYVKGGRQHHLCFQIQTSRRPAKEIALPRLLPDLIGRCIGSIIFPVCLFPILLAVATTQNNLFQIKGSGGTGSGLQRIEKGLNLVQIETQIVKKQRMISCKYGLNGLICLHRLNLLQAHNVGLTAVVQFLPPGVPRGIKC